MSRNRRTFLSYLPLAGVVPAGQAAAASPPGSLSERLLSAVEDIPLVDSHEHIYAEEDRIRQGMDFFTLVKHYVLQDAVSAGLSRDSVEVVSNEKASVAGRWRAFEPFWNMCASPATDRLCESPSETSTGSRKSLLRRCRRLTIA